MNENKNNHNDGEFYDDDGDRYISVEQSIIGACKEVNEMRAGRLKKKSLEEFFSEMDKWVAEVEEDESKKNISNTAF